MATVKQNDDFARSIFPIYVLDEAIEWIKKNLSPEDVFDHAELRDWAERNDFVEDED